MATTRVKRCAEPGCKAVIQDRLRYCARHRTRANDRPGRITAQEAGYGKRWSKFAEQFRREQPFCVRCQKPGHLVDHILPTDIWPHLFYETGNCQTLCHPCHAEKTAEDKSRIYLPTDEVIQDAARVVICGPPGSGKSSFAYDRGVDMVWDADAIARSLGVSDMDNTRVELIVHIRKSLETYLATHRKLRLAMIVTMQDVARRVANRIHAALVECRTPAETCKDRIRSRDTGDVERLCGAVDEYYRRFAA